MIDASKMIRVEELSSSGVEDAEELFGLAREAEAFLMSHRWCRAIRQSFFVYGGAGILAVFYLQIDPGEGADDAVWVIVGDIPPAYMDTFYCRDWAGALRGYVGAMGEWVDRVNEGASTEDCIPVLIRSSLEGLPPAVENAEMLERRLVLIEEIFLIED